MLGVQPGLSPVELLLVEYVVLCHFLHVILGLLGRGHDLGLPSSAGRASRTSI